MLSSGKKSPVKLQRNNENSFLLLLKQHLITSSKKLTWNSLHQEGNNNCHKSPPASNL